MLEFEEKTEGLADAERRGREWLRAETERQLAQRGAGERFSAAAAYGRRHYGGSAGVPYTEQPGYQVRLDDGERGGPLPLTCFIAAGDVDDAEGREHTALILRLWLDRALPEG